MNFHGLVTLRATIERTYITPTVMEGFADKAEAVAFFEKHFRASVERYCYDSDAELIEIEETEEI